MIKGRARHIPIRTDTVVRFGSEHVVLFLCLCDSVSKKRHKATTRNCVPQCSFVDVQMLTGGGTSAIVSSILNYK